MQNLTPAHQFTMFADDDSFGQRRGISRFTLIVGGLLWMVVIGWLVLVWQSRTDDKNSKASSADSSVSESSAADVVTPAESSVKISFPARPLPDFEFDRATGGTLSLADLKGKRWVASFVFTRCTSTCPTITRAVMEVHDRVQQTAPDAMFVSFTVDPKYDSVEVLKNYSETFTKGNSKRWAFLTGGQQEIFELIVNGFGLYVKENLGKSRMPGFEVAHSNRVVLVNEDGIPVGTFLGTVPADMVKLRRILAGQDEFPEPGPSNSPGFTVSTSDGQPLSIQFQAVPVTEESADGTAAEGDTAADAENDPDDPPASSGPKDPTDQSHQPDPTDLESATAPPSAAQHNALIDQRLPTWARQLPSVNAGLNSLAAILLMSGYVAIKNGKRQTHRNLMITAFLTSAVFLACYLVYHYALGKYTGEHGKRFAGSGLAATVYPFILWPHVVLAMLVPVMAIRVFQHAFAERWDAHKKLARITFPIWMFVSVTGVIIYGKLYHWPSRDAPAGDGVVRWVSAW